MVSDSIAFRLFQLWKAQQIAIIGSVDDLHPQYRFAYRNTLDRIHFFDSKKYDTLSAFCQGLVSEVLGSLKTSELATNEAYERGVNRALSDVLILLGEIPLMCISNNGAYTKSSGEQE